MIGNPYARPALSCAIVLFLLLHLGVASSAVDEIEEPVTAEQLPAPVRAAFDAFAAAGEVSGYIHEVDGEEEVYVAMVCIDGASFELELSPTGLVMEVEAADEDDEASDDGDDDEDGADGGH